MKSLLRGGGGRTALSALNRETMESAAAGVLKVNRPGKPVMCGAPGKTTRRTDGPHPVCSDHVLRGHRPFCSLWPGRETAIEISTM